MGTRWQRNISCVKISLVQATGLTAILLLWASKNQLSLSLSLSTHKQPVRVCSLYVAKHDRQRKSTCRRRNNRLKRRGGWEDAYTVWERIKLGERELINLSIYLSIYLFRFVHIYFLSSLSLSLSLSLHTHTHTHTHIYIYMQLASTRESWDIPLCY